MAIFRNGKKEAPWPAQCARKEPGWPRLLLLRLVFLHIKLVGFRLSFPGLLLALPGSVGLGLQLRSHQLPV